MSTKFVMLSDTHLIWDTPIARLDDARDAAFNKLQFVFTWAYRNDASILIAGDVFDIPRSWKLLPYVTKFLQKRRNRDVRVFAIFGQHDTYMASTTTRESTILGELIEAGLITLLNREGHYWDTDSIAVYGTSWGEDIPEQIYDYNTNILVIHKSITTRKRGELYWENHWVTPTDFVGKLKNTWDVILCGDIHKTFKVNCNNTIVCNSGPMLRLEASQDMLIHKPGFWVYDSKYSDLEWIKIPHEPAYKVLSTKHLELKTSINFMMDNFVKQMKSKTSNKGLKFRENLVLFMDENNVEQEVRNVISDLMGK